jgi:hypothetical protein
MKWHFQRKAPRSTDPARSHAERPKRYALFRKWFITFCICVITVSASLLLWGLAADTMSSSPFTMETLTTRVQAQGLRGTVHGANIKTRAYVLSVRNPSDFFDSYELSLVPGSPDIARKLQTLNRHDGITVIGRFLPNPTPQGHILVEKLTLDKPWHPNIPLPPQQSVVPADIVEDLSRHHELTGLVHAVFGEGRILVMDYRGTVIPVVVTDNTLARDLWRGDKITLRYIIQSRPNSPVHLVLDADTDNGKQPIRILESLSKLDGKPLTLEGPLILFPKSPLINRDIWALEQQDAEGNTRTFTLFNFDDAQDQVCLQQHLRSWWDQSKATLTTGRNKWINPQLKIRATGIANVESVNQANPQLKTQCVDVERIR